MRSTFCIRSFELRLDPVDGVTIALRALPAIAELRDPLIVSLYFLEIQAVDQRAHR